MTISYQGSYAIFAFSGKKANKEIYKTNIKDRYFSEILVQNTFIGSRIVVKTKKGYVPKAVKNKNAIVIDAIEMKEKEKKPHIVYNPVPRDMIAQPFFVSDDIYKPNTHKKEKSQAGALFYSGVNAYNDKNYSLASTFFKEIIDKYKNSKFYIGSHFLLGDCLKNLGDYENAIEVYKKAIHLSHKNDAVAQTMFNIADIYNKERHKQQERSMFKKIIDYYGDSWADKARFFLGINYLNSSNYKQANLVFSSISSKSPYFTAGTLLSAYSYHIEGNDAKAMLLYYKINGNLENIDVKKYENELISIAEVLCLFKDYKESNRIFSYVGSSGGALSDNLYLGYLKCDLFMGNYDDLQQKYEYLVSHSKNLSNIKKAKNLIDKAKLLQGKIGKEDLSNILQRYKNDKEMMPFLLFVYTKNAFEDEQYKIALKFMSELKKMYPKSVYNNRLKDIGFKSVEALFKKYKNDLKKGDLLYIYNKMVALSIYGDYSCDVAKNLIIFDQFDYAHNLSQFIHSSSCKFFVEAKYNVEKGNYNDALKLINSASKDVNQIPYINIIFGDISYYKSQYNKALEFYKKSYAGLKSKLLKDYVHIKIADVYVGMRKYQMAIDELSAVKDRILKNKAEYAKSISYYNLSKFQYAVKGFQKLLNDKQYEESSLFYLSLCYINLNNFKKANSYFDILKKKYPQSDFIGKLKVLMLK